MAKDFALDYIDVAERIVEFRTKHPDGSLQQVNLELREFAGVSWVIYTAAAYRTPDDPRPGQGTAWEPVPGRTPFTRGSEVQNAETAAWGRAIVAALAADTRRGVASAEEVRAAHTPATPSKPAGSSKPSPDSGEQISDGQRKAIHAALTARGVTDRDTKLAGFTAIVGRPVESTNDLTRDEARLILNRLDATSPGPDDDLPDAFPDERNPE